MIWTDGSLDKPQMGGSCVGGHGVYFLWRPEMNVSEFLPMGELQTIGRVELRAVPKALNEVTMLGPASILCDSKYIVDGCNGQGKKWQRNKWRTTAGPVIHTDVWKQILILLDVYGTHVTVHHVASHSCLTKNDFSRLVGTARAHAQSVVDGEQHIAGFCYQATTGRLKRADYWHTCAHATTDDTRAQ